MSMTWREIKRLINEIPEDHLDEYPEVFDAVDLDSHKNPTNHGNVANVYLNNNKYELIIL